MPTKNPRINVVVDPPLYELIEELAERQGVSMSLVTRDLIKEAENARHPPGAAAPQDLLSSAGISYRPPFSVTAAATASWPRAIPPSFAGTLVWLKTLKPDDSSNLSDFSST